MGCVHSTLRDSRNSLRAESKSKSKSKSTQSAAAASLEQDLPLSEEREPGSWNVFPTEDDRQRFIGAVLLVLTENGQLDIHQNRIKLHYSRASMVECRAVLAVMLDDNSIKHTHIGRRSAITDKEAFQHFMKEIYQEFDTLLVKAARNIRPRGQVATAPKPAIVRQATQASLRPLPPPQAPQPQQQQPPAIHPFQARVQFVNPADKNKSPRTILSVADRQATVPASLAYRLRPQALMMELLETRDQYRGYTSFAPYQRPHYGHQRIRPIQSVPTMRPQSSLLRPHSSIMRPHSSFIRPQSYMMTGALPIEEDYEEEDDNELLQHRRQRLSRQASFVTAQTHCETGPSSPRELQHSQSYAAPPPRPRLQHSQSLQFPAVAGPSRYVQTKQRLRSMPSAATLVYTPPQSGEEEQPGLVKFAKGKEPARLRVVNASIHASSSSGSTVHSREAVSPSPEA